MNSGEADLQVKLVRKPIRVLIVDGMSNHDWKRTTLFARAIYAKAGFFSVDVSTAPGTADAAAWRAWQPRFGDYETVVLNYNSGQGSGRLRWPAAREAELEAFVKGGGGLYVLHSANNSFTDWAEYNKMIGTGWRSLNFGYAFDGPASGGSNKNWPIELMVSYGGGQVYNSTTGHVWRDEIDGVRDLSSQVALIRATEWLARREVLFPVPAVFNTESKVVYADLVLP